MQPRNVRVFALVVILMSISAGIAVAQQPDAQTPTSQSGQTLSNQTPPVAGSHNAAEPKPPDMVCFGYGPNWSVQFVNGEARYLGINQPDQYFLGGFYWVTNEKAWEWHRENALAPMNGNFGLSATVRKQACSDPVRKKTFPYSAQVNLPTGDMVSGCCRKLLPGEAPVGKHGLPPQPGQQQAPAPQQQPQ